MLCPLALVSQAARNPLDPGLPPVISKWCAIEKEGRGLGPEDFHDCHDCDDGHVIGRETRQTSSQTFRQIRQTARQTPRQAPRQIRQTLRQTKQTVHDTVPATYKPE